MSLMSKFSKNDSEWWAIKNVYEVQGQNIVTNVTSPEGKKACKCFPYRMWGHTTQNCIYNSLAQGCWERRAGAGSEGGKRRFSKISGSRSVSGAFFI
jgi:hypothetical protein